MAAAGWMLLLHAAAHLHRMVVSTLRSALLLLRATPIACTAFAADIVHLIVARYTRTSCLCVSWVVGQVLLRDPALLLCCGVTQHCCGAQ